MYRDIGRIIVECQEAEGWGKSVVKRLSADLRQEFPGVSGFSVQNLRDMRQFYSEYHDNERLQPLVGEIAPVQTGGGGRKPEPELDALSNIIKAFNDRFENIDWEDEDRIRKVITEDIPAKVCDGG